MSDELYPMRLQRFLARAGVASRRGSERLMTSGRVRVNGEVVSELGSKVDPLRDVVTVDGMECRIQEKPCYLMLYKPAGCLSRCRRTPATCGFANGCIVYLPLER